MKVQYLEHYIEASDEFSMKDFSNKTLMQFYEVEDFYPGLIIYRSLFYHEKPGSITFPLGMRGVTFINCNLDNIILPPDNEYVDCSNRTFKSVDGKDMFIDRKGQVLEAVSKIKSNLKAPTWYLSLWLRVKSLWR